MKNVIIAITGLPNAGKTSFTYRLITGRFQEYVPTLGVDVEFARFKGYPIQVFDLGGHEAFRKSIWKGYIRNSNCLVFIFDATNLGSIKEGANWFWKCVEWLNDPSAPILFLANKADLIPEDKKDETIRTIVKEFKLEKFSNNGQRPFRFFFVSVKTGYNINEAMEWLVVKQFAEKQIYIPKVLSFDVFIKCDNVLINFHSNNPERHELLEIIQSYKDRFLQHKTIVNLIEETQLEEKTMVFLMEKTVGVLVISLEDFSKAPFKKLLELLVSYCRTLEKSGELIDKAAITELMHFLQVKMDGVLLSELINTITADIELQKK